jgi:hypothetical protein
MRAKGVEANVGHHRVAYQEEAVRHDSRCFRVHCTCGWVTGWWIGEGALPKAAIPFLEHRAVHRQPPGWIVLESLPAQHGRILVRVSLPPTGRTVWAAGDPLCLRPGLADAVRVTVDQQAGRDGPTVAEPRS